MALTWRPHRRGERCRAQVAVGTLTCAGSRATFCAISLCSREAEGCRRRDLARSASRRISPILSPGRDTNGLPQISSGGRLNGGPTKTPSPTAGRSTGRSVTSGLSARPEEPPTTSQMCGHRQDRQRGRRITPRWTSCEPPHQGARRRGRRSRAGLAAGPRRG
jgi:hypothetical protein